MKKYWTKKVWFNLVGDKNVSHHGKCFSLWNCNYWNMTFSSVSNNHLYSKSISMYDCGNEQWRPHITMHIHNRPWTPAAFIAGQQIHVSFLAHFLLYPDLDSVNVLPTPSTKYYISISNMLKPIQIWLILGHSILFLYPG